MLNGATLRPGQIEVKILSYDERHKMVEVEHYIPPCKRVTLMARLDTFDDRDLVELHDMAWEGLFRTRDVRGILEGNQMMYFEY